MQMPLFPPQWGRGIHGSFSQLCLSGGPLGQVLSFLGAVLWETLHMMMEFSDVNIRKQESANSAPFVR